MTVYSLPMRVLKFWDMAWPDREWTMVHYIVHYMADYNLHLTWIIFQARFGVWIFNFPWSQSPLFQLSMKWGYCIWIMSTYVEFSQVDVRDKDSLSDGPPWRNGSLSLHGVSFIIAQKENSNGRLKRDNLSNVTHINSFFGGRNGFTTVSWLLTIV